jgi:hypothetical protein
VTAHVEVEPGVFVPSKCNPTPGAGVEPNPCREPGSKLRCQLCPVSSTYWRRSDPLRSEGASA